MTTAAILSFSALDRDPRVMRQIDALRNDHRIVTCGYGASPPGADLHFEIPASARKLPINLPGLSALTLRATRIAYRFLPAARAAERLMHGAAFDVMIANDAVALPAALAIADGRPVIADLHELASEDSDDWRWRLLIKPLMERICRVDLPRAAAATTVGPGIAGEFERRYGVRCEIVPNARRFRAPQPRIPERPYRLVHHGACGRDREIERMIVGAGDVDGVELDLLLVRMPDDPGYLDELEALASRFRNVRILPPAPLDDIPRTLDAYDIGLCLYPPRNLSYLHSLPNKFFDFVQSGLPIIVGPLPDMQALVERHGLGIVLADFEPETLTAALRSLDAARVATWQRAVCAAAADLSGDAGMDVIRTTVAAAIERADGRTTS